MKNIKKPKKIEKTKRQHYLTTEVEKITDDDALRRVEEPEAEEEVWFDCEGSHEPESANMSAEIVRDCEIDKVNYCDASGRDCDIPPAMKFECVILQEEIAMRQEAVLDTGAGAGYFVCSNKIEIPFAKSQVCYLAMLADGSIRSIDEEISVTMIVADVQRSVNLRVLRSNSQDLPSVLFGRALTTLFNLTMEACSMRVNGRALVEYTARVDESLGEEAETSGKDLTDVPEATLDEEFVTLPISENDKKMVDDLLDEIANEKMGEELQWCPKASMRLRRLRPHERADLEIQRFTFELTLPSPRDKTAVSKNRCYSRALYERLSPESRIAFDKTLQSYVDLGWWTPTDGPLGPDHADLFAIQQSNKL